MLRKQAIKHFNTNKNWQTVLSIKSPLNKLLYAVIVLLVIAIVIFLFFGSLSKRESMQGILISPNEYVYTAVAEEDGLVFNVLVQLEDNVHKGQPLVKLKRVDLENKIILAKEQIALYQQEKARYISQRDKEIAIQQSFVRQEKLALEKIINFQVSHIDELKTALEGRQNLAKKGIISKITMEEQQRLFNTIVKSMNDNKSKLINVDSDLMQFTNKWNEKILDLDRDILEKKLSLQELEHALHVAETIHSPIDGKVMSIRVRKGNYVLKGTDVIRVSNHQKGVEEAYFFLPANRGQVIKKGMTVLISPSGYPSEEYGSILSSVKDVQNFPASKKALSILLQNDTLADKLLEIDKSLLIVSVKLEKSKQNPPQLVWTVPSIEPRPVKPGGFCTGSVIIERKRPITLLLPALKKLFGVSQ